MLKIEILDYEDLTDEQKEDVPNNGIGKEYASYLQVTYNGNVISLRSDAMEPEYARMFRDLSWIPDLLMQVYEIGKNEKG